MSDLVEGMYPDVLGSISAGLRTDLGTLQVALGIFPQFAFLNQPVELVLLLQNMVDQPTRVKVTLSLPAQDRQGNPLVLDVPEQTLKAELSSGEVGMLRIPIVAFPPTKPGQNIPIHVTVSHKSGRGAHPIRPRVGGVPPRRYAVSDYKLQALRGVSFCAPPPDNKPNQLTATMNIAPKRLEPVPYSLAARYETLWTMAELADEPELVKSRMTDARAMAVSMTTTGLYWSMYYATEEKWARRGVRLGEGELKAIAKILTYTLTDATDLESNYSLDNARWFQTLCSALQSQPEIATMDPCDVAAQVLYDAAIYDAVMLGFEIVESRVSANFGDAARRRACANQLIGWLYGANGASISRLYTPLILAGLSVNALVASTTESPWVMLDQLRLEAKARAATSGADGQEAFSMFFELATQTEGELARLHYTRPE